MHSRRFLFFSAVIVLFACEALAQVNHLPIMGWASWNNYRVDINENLITAQAEAMASNGMAEAGYRYINVDDGFFGGRDSQGNLKAHPLRFPSGMRAVSDHIHSLGLQAGIYTDAGINTCGSYWDQDTISSGCGLYGHDKQDLTRYLVDWNFDFIKVDWCGGEWLGLDEQERYTTISQIIYTIKPDVIYNVCRWQFPGAWVTEIADSWRISSDISDNFESILHIIDLNADLWRYSSHGHYNDMDMLQVGRGMTYDEDKSHFTMWCMMNSPLLAGNDLTAMSEQTLSILTNKDMISVNQDPLCYQARRIAMYGDIEVWSKCLQDTSNGVVAIALLNRSNEAQTFTLNLQSLGLKPAENYTIMDLWNKDISTLKCDSQPSFSINPHGVIALKITPENSPRLTLLETPTQSVLQSDDYYIWGASPIKGDDGKYHLYYSRWKKEYGFLAWVTHSEVAHAVADKPQGPYEFSDLALPPRGKEYWDGLNTHNPTIHKFGNKYYLYYTGNTGDGKNIKESLNASHRNNQRIGVAVADSPYGPWHRFDKPLIDTSEDANAYDALMVANPSITEMNDGRYLMVYKAVAKHKPGIWGGPVVHLCAISNSPTGPFEKKPEPIFIVKGCDFPAEDPYIWNQDGYYYAIVKDMNGSFTHQGRSLALFYSYDGFNWQPSPEPFVSKPEIKWDNGETTSLCHLERPQLLIEDGIPILLFLAADQLNDLAKDTGPSFNVHVPIKFCPKN